MYTENPRHPNVADMKNVAKKYPKIYVPVEKVGEWFEASDFTRLEVGKVTTGYLAWYSCFDTPVEAIKRAQHECYYAVLEVAEIDDFLFVTGITWSQPKERDVTEECTVSWHSAPACDGFPIDIWHGSTLVTCVGLDGSAALYPGSAYRFEKVFRTHEGYHWFKIIKTEE